MALIFDPVSDAVDKFMARVAVWVAERTGLRQLDGKAPKDASPKLAVNVQIQLANQQVIEDIRATSDSISPEDAKELLFRLKQQLM